MFPPHQTRLMATELARSGIVAQAAQSLLVNYKLRVSEKTLYRFKRSEEGQRLIAAQKEWLRAFQELKPDVYEMAFTINRMNFIDRQRVRDFVDQLEKHPTKETPAADIGPAT